MNGHELSIVPSYYVRLRISRFLLRCIFKESCRLITPENAVMQSGSSPASKTKVDFLMMSIVLGRILR